MDLTRFLGAHRFTTLGDLGQDGPCTWQLVRREGDGARFLLQLWQPRPSDRDLDHLREGFLGRFLDATPLDPIHCHFGFDDSQAWFLQVLQGTPLSRLWPEWGPASREAALRHLAAVLAATPHPRFLHPEALTFRPGHLFCPRVLGHAPWGLDHLGAFLPEPAAEPSGSEERPWALPPDLSEPLSRPIRGRSQELTYLKSLVLGLGAPISMERIVLLQGEEGVGKAHLAAWACAVAESEGIWVHRLAPAPEESAGRFLGRLLESLLQGSEADFYAQNPGAAKTLALRLQAFAFLTGGRAFNHQEAAPDAEEVRAVLEALAFAADLHGRFLHLSDLDRGTPEVLALVRELVHASRVPWLLSLSTGAHGAGLKPLIAQLRAEPTAALVGLNRLEDEDLRMVLEDLLGPHRLPAAYLADLLEQSLGNPGLLRSLLELAQQDGSLLWEPGGWALAPHHPAVPRAEEDLMRQIFLGRLQRLQPASATLVRLLALADRPLPTGALGRLLGLAGDPLDDALQGAVGSRLVQLRRNDAAIPDPRWRQLVLAHTPQPELKRLARALLAHIQEQGGDLAFSVTLQALASDQATALAAVLSAIHRQPPAAPQEAQRVVEQALALRPGPAEEAQLHEYLADAWATGSQGARAPQGGQAPRPAATLALAALRQAQEALARIPAADQRDLELTEARLLRKQARLELLLRHPAEAQEAIHGAAARLSDHPLHPEQPRLRLALGEWHLLQGFMTKGIRALEEGLQLLNGSGGKPRPQDQAALLLALGRALTGQAQFHRAATLLQSSLRLLEPLQDYRGLVPVQIALGRVRLAQGQSEGGLNLLQAALQTARLQSDAALQLQAHLALGSARSLQQSLGAALSHLERALQHAEGLGDAAAVSMAHAWKARTLAALGDLVAADHAQLAALATRPAVLAPEELGDQMLLQAEVAHFRSAWRDAARLYQAAATQYETTGFLWRQRLALLRFAQAEAREAQRRHQEAPEQGWTILENLKGPVEGSDSRLLEQEWHRAHALLLSTVPPSETVAQETLQAWSEVLAAARSLQHPAEVLEASAEGAALLLQRGEKLGARARMQEAFPSFQQLWARLPEGQEIAFLGREDLHRFKETVEAVGLRFVLPDRTDSLADWTPTQMNLPSLPDPV